MNRNFAFARSVIFSAVAKVFGFFVVFACLPLAALSLSTKEYATFNFSMTITGLLSITFSPLSALLIGRFARLGSLKYHHAIGELAELSIRMFALLGLTNLPFSLFFAFYLAPLGFRSSIVLASIAVVATSVVSWGEVFRLGQRMDHITSAFALGNNISIIALFFILYHSDQLSYGSVMMVYYGSPLLWGLLSFLQLIGLLRLRVRFAAVRLDDCRKIFHEALPLLTGNLADYVRLNVSSLLAFYLSTSQDYSVYSTVMLLIARLTNPVTLLSRPLIPAYIDAIVRQDSRWIAMFKRIMATIAVLFVLSTVMMAVVAALYPFEAIRVGAIDVEKNLVRPYLVGGALLLVSAVFLVLLASIYLAAQKMTIYSLVSSIANVAAVVTGAIMIPIVGTVGLFVAVAICNALSAAYLSWRFFRDPMHLA